MTLSDAVCCLSRATRPDFTTKDAVEIIVISNRKLGRKKRARYTWAWRESAENGVFGCADSKETGVSTATLSSWKAGDYVPKIDKLQKIADYFGVPVTYFLAGGGN